MTELTFMRFYVVMTIIIAAFDLVIAVQAYRQKTRASLFMCLTSFFAMFVDIFYTISAETRFYRVASVFSSLYFLSISAMLLSLFIFFSIFTGYDKLKRVKKLTVFLLICFVYEIIIFTVNIFKEIAVSYVDKASVYAAYKYAMKPLFYGHLGYTYLMVLLILFMLFIKISKVPREYRTQYIGAFVCIIAIVATNALYLYIPLPNLLSQLDVSIFAYSIGLISLFWGVYRFSNNGMYNMIRNNIVENIDQGIILFDNENRLIVNNDKAKKIIGENELNRHTSIESVLSTCGLSTRRRNSGTSISTQCYIKKDDRVTPIRCDYKVLKNERNEIWGRLFVLTDVVNESDLLTGFHSWEPFKSFVSENSSSFSAFMQVAIVDINALALINTTLGRNGGDAAIQDLADKMRREFPNGTYFIRGQEARLVALIDTASNDLIRDIISRINEESEYKVQYSVSRIKEENNGILIAIDAALEGLKAKKMLDKDSAHSQVLTSLMKALQECDEDTEAHVKRTKRMGQLLGEKLGLNDIQQSQLSLLCMLHDIGKIGIPLEILNKPGDLTDYEWETLKTHVFKGYQIAMSTEELKSIADYILHHHERWDGKGYPDGLSKESIPLLSRIISVVDSYDAMIYNRAYRKAVSRDTAKDELKRCAGTQFDPNIVSAYLELLNEREDVELGSAAMEENMAGAKDESEGSKSLSRDSLRFSEEESEGINSGKIHIVNYSRYMLDSGMRIVSVDDNFVRMTGYSREEIEKGDYHQFDMIPESERTEYLKLVNERSAKSPIVYIEHNVKRKDGSTFYALCYGKIYYDSAARETRTEIIIVDPAETYIVKRTQESERGRSRRQLERVENVLRNDDLTGIMNRNAFKGEVEAVMLSESKKILMLMMDVDKFKEYNDTYGHPGGDSLLIAVAKTLSEILRRGDLCCRMGGDEFAAALFFDKATDTKVMFNRAEQIFNSIGHSLKENGFNVSISMGASVSSEALRNFNMIYQASDIALYKSKQNGRGQISFYGE